MPSSSRKIARELEGLMSARQLPNLLRYVDNTADPKSLITPLIRFFYRADSLDRWFAIKAFGRAVAKIAEMDMEQARIIMRRLMWSLNDESGGIGWGAPEAMAEAMANSRSLAEEYARILLSYVWEDGNYLEYLPLRRGALWGLYRLAHSHPDIFKEIGAHRILEQYLDDEDPESQALAILALGAIADEDLCAVLKQYLSNKQGYRQKVLLFGDDALMEKTIGDMASMVLEDCGH